MAIRDLDRAFPDTPDVFTEAIFRGFAAGRRREKRRRILISSISAAAVVVLAAAGLWGAMRMTGGEDNVASPAENGVEISGISRVYTGQADEFFHAGEECAGGVEMSVDAARGFGKLPCPRCLEGVKE